MKTEERHIRLAVGRVAYDIVLTATSDTGVAKLGGIGYRIDPADSSKTLEELGPIDLTIWGATTEQLKMRTKSWPARFDKVTGDAFGVSAGQDHRFDLFVSGERFMRLLDLAHGSRRASIILRCRRSADGSVDLVHEMEISAARG